MIKCRSFSVLVSSLLKIPRINSRNIFKAFSTRSEAGVLPLKAVDLSYATYESQESKQKDLTPLIILHGMMCAKDNWSSLCEAINENTGRKVIAIDARNHGDSPRSEDMTYGHMVEDVLLLLNNLNITKTVVLGHSMGGRTAMVLSLLKPELVSSLIVGDVSPITTSPTIIRVDHLLDSMLSVKIPPGISLEDARKTTEEQLSATISNVPIRDFLVKNVVQSSGSNEITWRLNLPVLKASFMTGLIFFPDFVKTMKYPGSTHFIIGSKSDHISINELPDLRKGMFPKAEATVIEGAGHWPHSRKPDEFLKIVCDFLAKN